jgi:predicted Fe-Mo cluster-binding NifX family protein
MESSFNAWLAEDEGMKIAVAAVAREANSEISPRSGRSKFFLIFDEAGKLLEVLSNPFSRGGGGAGFGVAKMLADQNVDIVVGRQIGDNMEEALQRRGIRVYEMTGRANEAVGRVIIQESG